MTTSILDEDELLRMISGEKPSKPTIVYVNGENPKPVSGAELIKRIKELFTPEEAEALARRIEEGREQAYD